MVPDSMMAQSSGTVSRVLAVEFAGGVSDRRRVEQSLDRLKELYLAGDIECDEYRRRRAEYENTLEKMPTASTLPVATLTLAATAERHPYSPARPGAVAVSTT